MGMKHATLSASGAPRWIACPASTAMEKLYGKDEGSSSFAAEGTAAHSLGEGCLRTATPPSEYLDSFIKVEDQTFEVNQEMVEAVTQYTEYVQNLGGTLFIETRVDFSHYVPKGFGTSDAIVEKGDTLHVIDLKYGKGVQVFAGGNEQAMLYGIGALNSLSMMLSSEIKKVVITIVQPRLDHIDEYTISVDALLEWAETVAQPQAARAWELLNGCKAKDKANDGEGVFIEGVEDADFGPSEKACKWCKAKECRARARAAYESAVVGFDAGTDITDVILGGKTPNHEFFDPLALSNAELVAAYNNTAAFGVWIKKLKGEIMDRMKIGDKFPGLKAVKGKATRAWGVEDEELIKRLKTAGLLKADFETVSLISPAQAEKKIKEKKPKDHKKRYNKLAAAAVSWTEGSPTLAPESDKREALFTEVEAEFSATTPDEQTSQQELDEMFA